MLFFRVFFCPKKEENKMTEVRLTEKQRRFAEEQHHILLDFLQGRSLAEDEFYDIVVFPFLEAVCNYDAGRDFIDESFEVFAGRCMREAVGRHFAEEKKGKKDAVILSLDYPVSHTDGLTFGDTIADLRVNPFDDVDRKLSRPKDGYRLLHRYSGGKALRQLRIREVYGFQG